MLLQRPADGGEHRASTRPQLFGGLKQQTEASKDGGHRKHRWTAAGPHPTDAQNQSLDQDLHNQAGSMITRAALSNTRIHNSSSQQSAGLQPLCVHPLPF